MYIHRLNWANNGVKFDYWGGRKTLLHYRLYGLMTRKYKFQRFLETATLEVLTKEVAQFDQLKHLQNTDVNRRLQIDFF